MVDLHSIVEADLREALAECSDFNKARRQVSLKHHPDKGGSVEAMHMIQTVLAAIEAEERENARLKAVQEEKERSVTLRVEEKWRRREMKLERRLAERARENERDLQVAGQERGVPSQSSLATETLSNSEEGVANTHVMQPCDSNACSPSPSSSSKWCNDEERGMLCFMDLSFDWVRVALLMNQSFGDRRRYDSDICSHKYGRMCGDELGRKENKGHYYDRSPETFARIKKKFGVEDEEEVEVEEDGSEEDASDGPEANKTGLIDSLHPCHPDALDTCKMGGVNQPKMKDIFLKTCKAVLELKGAYKQYKKELKLFSDDKFFLERNMKPMSFSIDNPEEFIDHVYKWVLSFPCGKGEVFSSGRHDTLRAALRKVVYDGRPLTTHKKKKKVIKEEGRPALKRPCQQFQSVFAKYYGDGL